MSKYDKHKFNSFMDEVQRIGASVTSTYKHGVRKGQSKFTTMHLDDASQEWLDGFCKEKLGATNLKAALTGFTKQGMLRSERVMNNTSKIEPKTTKTTITIPLEKLYGKVDFETFISIINE